MWCREDQTIGATKTHAQNKLDFGLPILLNELNPNIGVKRSPFVPITSTTNSRKTSLYVITTRHMKSVVTWNSVRKQGSRDEIWIRIGIRISSASLSPWTHDGETRPPIEAWVKIIAPTGLGLLCGDSPRHMVAPHLSRPIDVRLAGPWVKNGPESSLVTVSPGSDKHKDGRPDFLHPIKQWWRGSPYSVSVHILMVVIQVTAWVNFVCRTSAS